jgi:hypothetical protein
MKIEKLVGVLGFIGIAFLVFTSCFPAAELPVSAHPHASIENIDDTLNSTIAFIRPRAEVEARGPATSESLMTSSEWSGPYCAGFYIAPNYIVSAAHCFQSSVTITMPDGSTISLTTDSSNLEGVHVWFVGYDEMDLLSSRLLITIPHSGEVVYHDQTNDTVILRTEDSSSHFVSLAEREPDVSEHVYAIGHPAGMAWSIADGMISRVFERNDHLVGIQTTVPTVGGCSGGPLLSESGEVLGMADAYVAGFPHLSLYVATDAIRTAYHIALISVAMEAFTTDPNN